MNTVDLNCDLGEGTGVEAEMMPWITSANIACGYHAGDEALMFSTMELCREHRVAVGAHPSFPDRTNFGRTAMHLSSAQIIDIVGEQLILAQRIAQAAGVKLHHVKPHGALYNMAANDAVLSKAIAQAVLDVDPSLIVYGLSNSTMLQEATSLGLEVAHEVFADRTYQPNGTLTPRTQPNALIEKEEDAIQQALEFVTHNSVRDVNGDRIPVRADTICLHGDGAHAVAFARLIHQRLVQSGISLLSPKQSERS